MLVKIRALLVFVLLLSARAKKTTLKKTTAVRRDVYSLLVPHRAATGGGQGATCPVNTAPPCIATMGSSTSNAIKNAFDPPPPTYFPTASPTMGPTTLTGVALTFFNAINDKNYYYLSITEVNGISWSSLPLSYGQSLEFSKTVPTPVGYTGFDYSQYQVVRFDGDNIVANMFPFPLDNRNQILVVAWNDAQNQIYTETLGTYGSSDAACVNGPYDVSDFINCPCFLLFATIPSMACVSSSPQSNLSVIVSSRSPQPRLPVADELERHVAHHLHLRQFW
jgi:hypothetical protein